MYSRDELVYELEQTYEQMEELVQNLAHLINYIPDGSLKERARRMMLAHFQMALNNDHMWLGGNMYTLSDLIEDMQDPGLWNEGDEQEDEMKEEAIEQTPAPPMEEACGPVAGETYLVVSNNLLANIGCKEVAEAFAQFLTDKGLHANVHPVGSAIAKDAMAVRTEEIARHVQMYMQEFAESDYNPMRQ
jgi:hypothetical protein